MQTDLEPGRIRLRGVSRSFRIVHERNLTLKETLLRRGRTKLGDEELWALRDVDLDVAPGEAVGVIGQNGSGKSTMLKLVAGIIPPAAGTIATGGTVASMLELGAGFHPDFTGRENVYMNGSIYGLSTREVDQRFDEIVSFSELQSFIDMPVKTYSSGMYMRLAFAIASHVSPDILLLDEVLAVGDAAFQRKCFGRIFEFRRGGGTLLFVSHDPGAVEMVCDRVVLLRDGVVIADGPPTEVLAVYHRGLAAATGAPGAQAGERADGETEDDPRTWGTRDAVIRSVRLVGPDGPTTRFLSGDPFRVELEVEAPRPVATPNFGVSIHSVEGALCYGTNTRLDAFDIPEISGVTRVTFDVPALALHEGEFIGHGGRRLARPGHRVPLARPVAGVHRVPALDRPRHRRHGRFLAPGGDRRGRRSGRRGLGAQVDVGAAPRVGRVAHPGHEVVGAADDDRVRRGEGPGEVLAHEEGVDPGQVRVHEPVPQALAQGPQRPQRRPEEVRPVPDPGLVEGLDEARGGIERGVVLDDHQAGPVAPSAAQIQ